MTGTLSAVGRSGIIQVGPGQSFTYVLTSTHEFVGTLQLRRSTDGSTWHALVESIGTVAVPVTGTIASGTVVNETGARAWYDVAVVAYGGTSDSVSYMVSPVLPQEVVTSQVTLTSTELSSGGTYTFTAMIPAGSIVLAVNTRVIKALTGATSYSVGDGTEAGRWGAGIAVAVGTKTTLANATITSLPLYASATSVVLTAGGSSFTAGVIQVTVHYMSIV